LGGGTNASMNTVSFISSFSIFLLLLLKSASKGANECLIQYGKSRKWVLGVICELKFRGSLQASCEKTLGSGKGLSGSLDDKDTEATAAWFVSLCNQCYKASLVSLYVLRSFWCFLQNDNKNFKLLSCEKFVRTVERFLQPASHSWSSVVFLRAFLALGILI